MINEEILDIETALSDMSGDQEIYEEVAELFVNDTPRILSEMKSVYKKNDITTINRHAHSIKSSSRTVGGMRLSTVAARLEEETNNSNLSNIENLIEEMIDEFEKLKNALIEKGF